MTREEWLKTLKSDPGTLEWYEENKDHLNFAEKEKWRFLKASVSKNPPFRVVCAYGPEEDGYGDAWGYIRFPEEGGTYTEIFGCPFKLKGMSPRDVVFAFNLPKYLMSDFLKHIWISSKLISFFLFLGWIFNRKGFLNLVLKVLTAIEHRTIEKFTVRMKESDQAGHEVFWPDEWYNEPEKEIERCLVQSAKGEGIWEKIFEKLGKFFKIFLYIDNTYKSRVQDCLSEGEDLFGTLEVLLKREHGPIRTWRYTKYILKVALMTSPALKRICTRFFNNLDREKVKMDLNEVYFSLTYRSYDFRGVPYEQRRAERERLNKEYKVVYI